MNLTKQIGMVEVNSRLHMKRYCTAITALHAVYSGKKAMIVSPDEKSAKSFIKYIKDLTKKGLPGNLKIMSVDELRRENLADSCRLSAEC